LPYTSNPNCNTKSRRKATLAPGRRRDDIRQCTGKTAYAENETAFRNNMGDLIQDLVNNYRFSNVTGFYPQNVNGLTASTAAVASTNNGAITGSQVDLSYSFELTVAPGLILHFAVINTDPRVPTPRRRPTGSRPISQRPTRRRQSLLCFGHKPAFTYNYNANDGEPRTLAQGWMG